MGTGVLMRATGAALAAGVAGAVVWGIVEVQTGYETGIAAAGIGWLVGTAVLRISGGRGVPFQAIAIVASLAAIVLGKYIAFAYVIGPVGWHPGQVTLWSGDVMRDFLDTRGKLFGGFDLLWAGFAIVAGCWVLRVPAAAPGRSVP